MSLLKAKCNLLFGSVIGIAAMMPLAAHAAVVDYTTTATFTCSACTIVGNGTGSVMVTYGSGANTATLLFTGTPAGTSVSSDGSFATAGFGTIKASDTGTGSMINGGFTIDVNQTTPNTPPVTGALATAMLSGKVFDGSSTSYANFGSEDPEIVLGGPVTYELDTSKKVGSGVPGIFGYTIVSPDTGTPAGVTSFQGNIEATPEPAFLTLTGAGFTALAAIALRRRKRESIETAE